MCFEVILGHAPRILTATVELKPKQHLPHLSSLHGHHHSYQSKSQQDYTRHQKSMRLRAPYWVVKSRTFHRLLKQFQGNGADVPGELQGLKL